MSIIGSKIRDLIRPKCLAQVEKTMNFFVLALLSFYHNPLRVKTIKTSRPRASVLFILGLQVGIAITHFNVLCSIFNCNKLVISNTNTSSFALKSSSLIFSGVEPCDMCN